jgi:Leucine-rich repeat (LRR) protein
VIYAPHNRISSLILPDDPQALTRLELPVNRLESIDLRSCSSLSLVSLASNLIVSIDVSGMDALEELHLDDNPLQRIILGNKMLRYINLQGTSITEVDFSRCPRLDLADCSGCPDLKTIHLAKGQVIGTIRKDDTASIVYHDE